MALPTIFANLTAATGAELDGNFAALGALIPISCTFAGTNAIAATPVTNAPAISAYSNYQFFIGAIVTTNTGATTVAVGTLPALPVYKDTPAGPVALSGGELVAKDLAYFFYDSALNGGAGGFHAVSQAGFPAAPPVRSNWRLRGSSPGGGVTASWTAVELIAEVTVGGQAVKGSNLTLSFNGATTGVNGMDTGTVSTSSQLAVYAIFNPTTQAWGTLGYSVGLGAASVVYPGANAPAGYTYSCILNVVVTDGSGHIPMFFQDDNRVALTPTQVLSATAGTAGVWTSLSLASIVPVGANNVSGQLAGAAAHELALSIASNSSGGYQQFVVQGNATAAVGGYYAAGRFSFLPMVTPQVCYWSSGNTTQTNVILINGYEV